jgi:glycosyltransferase involved in cell wall biosynthesis
VPRNDEPKRVIIQMTEPKTRNPYFGLLERPFRLAGYDFRYSTDLPAMVDYSRKRSDLPPWFHQLDPFYHGPDGAAPTSARATRLISHLRAIRDSGNRVLLTWHNPVPHDKRYLDIDLALYRALDQCLDGIIVHCDMGRNWIRDICPRVPIATLPHPSYDSHYQVTINRQVARSHLRVPQDAFLFCTFGEMKPYKNARTLIDAWGVYQRTSADRRSQLLMLGKWRSEGRDFLDANLLQNALIVNRIASDSEIALAITAADVCVFTHANIWVSGAAIAAMSLGRPIIVPTGTGISEYVLPGDNGWLFPNGDAAALAATMVDAVASDRLAHMAAINRGVSGDWSPYRLQPRYAAFLTSLG